MLLVGHEVGACVAQATARLAPDRLAGLFLMDGQHPAIGARRAAPRRIAELWYQTFHQQPFAAALVGASRATCRAHLGHFLRHRAPASRIHAALLAGLLLVPPGAALAATPEELVRARCATCHGRGLPELVESCARRRGQEGLDAFLARHHARDPDERAAIVAYLRACPPGEPLPPR